MKKVILYLNEENQVCIMHPVQSFLDKYEVSLEELAIKNVVHNNPFWIVNFEDIPKDILEFWAGIELDEDVLGEPSGIGGKEDYYTKKLVLRKRV